MNSYAPNQYLSDSFKYRDNWEVITESEYSNQVIVRMSYQIEWINKPWLLGHLIE